MSISQNFPAEGPTLTLNFAGSKKLDPRITFTRTSTATYMDDNGLITIAPTNTPRFEHSVVGVGTTVTGVESLGLLIEESRTNLITYSEQFNDASWSKFNVGVTTNTTATTAPDGSTNSELMTRTTTSAAYFLKSYTKAASSITYTASAFVKKSVGDYCALTTQGTYPSRAAVVFNINSGTISTAAVAYSSFSNASASIIPYPNGWYRISLTATSDTATTYDTYFTFNSNGGEIDFNDTASNSAGYIWGAQLEAGAFPTSYIPTVASTVTRSADNATMTGTNFSSWYNSSEGSVLFSGRTGGGTEPCFLTFSNAATSPTDIIRYTFLASTTKSRFLGLFSSGTVFDISSTNTFTSGSLFKTAGCYKLNDFANVLNGSTVGTDTSGNVPIVNRLHLGDNNGYGTYLNGTISQILYYPTRLSNSQLQNLTK